MQMLHPSVMDQVYFQADREVNLFLIANVMVTRSEVWRELAVLINSSLTLDSRSVYNAGMENEAMETLTVSVSEALMKEIAPYRGELAELLRLGLRQVKMEQALALYKQGGISIWRGARLAGVSLREMTQYAAAQGLRAVVDDDTLREELA